MGFVEGGAYRDLAELLLDHKADADAKDNYGQTPLHGAAAAGHNGMVQLLLANQAESNARNNNGHTPLYLAELHAREHTVELLPQYGEPLGWSQPTSRDPFIFPTGNAYSVSDLVRLSEGERAAAR